MQTGVPLLKKIERAPNFSTILDKKDHCNSAQSWVFSTRLDVVAKRFINRNCKVVLGNPNFTHYSFSTKKISKFKIVYTVESGMY